MHGASEIKCAPQVPNENKSFQSHYFIKFDDDVSEEIYKKIESIQFDSNNTVGPKSISKQEVIKEFNKIIL